MIIKLIQILVVFWECKRLDGSMNFKKIVFLDIDGVLNHDGFFAKVPDNEAEWKCIDEEKVKLLKDIHDATGCDYVLSSSWRNGWKTLRKYKMYNYAYKIFKKYGIDFDGEFGLLPNYGYGRRGDEIYDYIKEHNVEKYAILDDQYVDLPNLVRVNGSKGIELSDVEKIIEILNKKEEP